MFKKIICLMFGHKKYEPNVLKNKNLFEVKDELGSILVAINICKLCGAVYSDYPT